MKKALWEHPRCGKHSTHSKPFILATSQFRLAITLVVAISTMPQREYCCLCSSTTWAYAFRHWVTTSLMMVNALWLKNGITLPYALKIGTLLMYAQMYDAPILVQYPILHNLWQVFRLSLSLSSQARCARLGHATARSEPRC